MKTRYRSGYARAVTVLRLESTPICGCQAIDRFGNRAHSFRLSRPQSAWTAWQKGAASSDFASGRWADRASFAPVDVRTWRVIPTAARRRARLLLALFDAQSDLTAYLVEAFPQVRGV